MNNLDNLALLIKQQKGALLARWREQLKQLPSAKSLDTPTLTDHIPGLLDELAQAFEARSTQTIAGALVDGTPPEHGRQRLRDGFEIEEVVAEYNILRGCIHDLADEKGLSLQGQPFRILNGVFDESIGLAVQTYATQLAGKVQQRREDYLAFVAHDLRTPLNAISLAARVLEMKLAKHELAAETDTMLKTLHRNIQYLSNMVSKILEENTNLQTETGIKLERRMLDLWPLVEALIHDLKPVAGTGSTQLVNKVPEDLIAYADAALLRRIFQNLIANALLYTPRGEVVIGAQENKSKNVIECWVSDNGAGIAAERVEKVFDKFHTNPEKEGGTGLGLTIFQVFVEVHGGTVQVESRLDIGTTFHFTLPLKQA